MFSLLLHYSALGQGEAGRMQVGREFYECWEHPLQSQNVQGSQSLNNYTGCWGLPALFSYNGNLANFPLAQSITSKAPGAVTIILCVFQVTYTIWIELLTPHAGELQGIRFLIKTLPPKMLFRLLAPSNTLEPMEKVVQVLLSSHFILTSTIHWNVRCCMFSIEIIKKNSVLHT